jgi:hypothetical protein
MKTVFFTIISSSHYRGCRTDEFIKSFKKFHPDIDLVVFGDEEIQTVFSKDKRLNFYNCKATFAKLLYNDYNLVVNIDADHLVFDRMDEILGGDYDVAIPANFNSLLNSGIGINSFANACGVFSSNVLVPYEKYIQGGLIASTSKLFWDQYEYASLNYSDLFGNKENDVLNLLCHMLPYKVKVLEGHWEYTHSDFNCYYGCSSLGRERDAIIDNEQIKLDGKPIKAYHFARASINKIPIDYLFNQDVCSFIRNKILQ